MEISVLRGRSQTAKWRSRSARTRERARCRRMRWLPSVMPRSAQVSFAVQLSTSRSVITWRRNPEAARWPPERRREFPPGPRDPRARAPADASIDRRAGSPAKKRSGVTVTVREVASVLHVSPALVYKLCERHELRSLRIGGALRFHEATVSNRFSPRWNASFAKDADCASVRRVTKQLVHRPPSTSSQQHTGGRPAADRVGRSAADAIEERRRAAEEHGDAAAKVCPRAELAQDRASIEQHVPAGDDSADRHRPRCLHERVPRGSDPLRRRGDCNAE